MTSVRLETIVRQILAIGLLPGMATITVPAIVLSSTRTVNIGWSLKTPLNFLPPLFGVLCIAAGLFLMFQTIGLFITAGKGTLAPWDPPQRLVVRGVYRHVRNPMISGVLCVLLGEALLLGSAALLQWFAFFLAVNLVYIPLLEEPILAERFGDEYARYKANVPRWIPRLTPCEAPSD